MVTSPPTRQPQKQCRSTEHTLLSRGPKALTPKRGKSRMHEARFYLGQQFGSAKEVKEQVRRHAILTKRELSFFRNDKAKIRVVCEGNVPVYMKGDGKRKERLDKVVCPFMLYVSKEKDEVETWTVKTHKPEHTCLQTRESLHLTAKFMAKEPAVKRLVECNKDISVRTIQEELARKYELRVSRMKAFRAMSLASKEVQGDNKEQYSRLRDYIMELQSANPDTTVHIDVESEPNPASSTRVFKRIYICLGPLKLGFKECGRDILDLDGAFLKGSQQGQVLVAVGLDSNNGLYPLAYAIAEAENKNSWTWFLECLKDDLALQNNSWFTFISDRQKDLIPALEKVFPAAEHRFCLRKIHQNMKLKWRGKGFKDCLWSCATARTVPEFREKIEELKKFNEEAYNWLEQIPPKHWSRSHFTGWAQSDVLLSNMCEVLNAKTVEGREKPIISCLEYLREYLMKRIVNVMKEQHQCKGPLTPKITEILDEIKKAAAQCTVKWCGDSRWQVQGTLGQLGHLRIGSIHATIWTLGKKAYAYKVGPINGPKLWPISPVPTTLTPPLHHKQAGRPKKKRRRDQVEVEDAMEKKGKLTRKGGTVTCKKCNVKGHNSRSCKDLKKGMATEGCK
ncbi:uncharacterized protein LOC110944602 [Helianthus annuus]|uniref:uncharacterized protein LOC110944602 n=1 Tax=Helianthus annuus TaxID=4232 RepID=UPI000B90844E|nr:uncharacterized protein LOC110944602 [Helianthus annuus]